MLTYKTPLEDMWFLLLKNSPSGGGRKASTQYNTICKVVCHQEVEEKSWRRKERE